MSTTVKSPTEKITAALRDAPMMALPLDDVVPLVGSVDVALETLLALMLQGMVTLRDDYAVMTIEGRIRYGK